MEGHFTENPIGRGMRAVATWFVQISDDFTFRCPSVSLPQQVSNSPTRCSLGVFYQVLARIYANGPHDRSMYYRQRIQNNLLKEVQCTTKEHRHATKRTQENDA